MDEFKKLKCVFCNYEIATKSKTPRCTKCGSRRLNQIQQFSAVKPFKTNEVKTMPEETKEVKEEKPAVKKKQVREDYDEVEADIWGEDEED